MPFINTKWLNFLGLEMPHTVDEFEQVLTAFRDNAASIQSEFGIEGSIIPMSCIVNDGDQDPAVLINGFGEGYGDMDKGRHIAVTNDRKVICAAAQEGYRDGIQWLHKLYTENLIDPECFTQEWSTYVSKGKAGRYGVCFSWDVANIDNLTDWEPLPPLAADTTNITPQNGSFTSGFNRGRCVVTAKAANPALVCAWLDQMYIPIQSAQNNWGTYGEDDGFDIFVMSTNADGEPMLKHAPLGDASPVEVREAESVNGPLAVLLLRRLCHLPRRRPVPSGLDRADLHPRDAQRLCFPQRLYEQRGHRYHLRARDRPVHLHELNGMAGGAWEEYLGMLEEYRLSDYLAIMQKYLDAYYA